MDTQCGNISYDTGGLIALQHIIYSQTVKQYVGNPPKLPK